MISNVHADLPLTTVKRWDSSARNHIKIDCPHCIKKCNKYIGGVDSLDALVSLYRIDVHGKKWYWLHYINTVKVLKSAAFKVFQLINSDAKIGFLTFTRRVAMHYLKAAKVRRQLPQTSFIQEKDPRKKTQQFPKMKETRKPLC